MKFSDEILEGMKENPKQTKKSLSEHYLEMSRAILSTAYLSALAADDIGNYEELTKKGSLTYIPIWMPASFSEFIDKGVELLNENCLKCEASKEGACKPIEDVTEIISRALVSFCIEENFNEIKNKIKVISLGNQMLPKELLKAIFDVIKDR
jgi:hypothetical protein